MHRSRNEDEADMMLLLSENSSRFHDVTSIVASKQRGAAGPGRRETHQA
jgi:hypothetical protein